MSKINTATSKAHDFLKETDHLLITLGSAWVYTLTENASDAIVGTVAANNHKAPANWFSRKLMSVDETLEIMGNLMKKLLLFNPKLKLIFTISPVRHIREGVIENNRSKAVLIQAVHELVEQYSAIYYFPAYELVMDDLRDYRFYAEDLVHPNYYATQYVWEKFTEACMDEETNLLLKEIAEVNLAFQHKPFNPSTEQHLQFLQLTGEKIKKLQAKYPFLDFSREMVYFSA